MTRDDLQALRAAAYDGDSSGLLRILDGEVRLDALQLVGDALKAATAQGIPGAAGIANAWADALRERGWAGDVELAAELDGVTGRRPIPAGRRLLIDLEDLAELLECGFGEEGGRINLETGDAWRANTVCFAPDPQKALVAGGGGLEPPTS